MSKVHAKGSSVQNTSVDSASYVMTNWLSGGQLSPPHSLVNVQVALGTLAAFNVEFATGAAGTGAYATLELSQDAGGASLVANRLYLFKHLARASIYFNYKLGATSTVKMLEVAEQFDW